MLSQVDVQPATSLILASTLTGVACNNPTTSTRARRDYWFLADSPLIMLTKADGSEQVLHLSLRKKVESGHPANQVEAPSPPTGLVNDAPPALPPKRGRSWTSQLSLKHSRTPPISDGHKRLSYQPSQSTPPPLPLKTVDFERRRARQRMSFGLLEIPNPPNIQTLPLSKRLSHLSTSSSLPILQSAISSKSSTRRSFRQKLSKAFSVNDNKKCIS